MSESNVAQMPPQDPELVTPEKFLEILKSPFGAWSAWTNGKIITFRYYGSSGEHKGYVACLYENCPNWDDIILELVARDTRFETVVWMRK